MKRSPEQKWLIVGFAVASLLMGWVSFTAHQNTARLLESTNKSKQTHEVIKNLINIYATMTVAESGRRGYVFLNDEKELYRYQAAAREIRPNIQALRQSLGPHPEQLERLKRLDELLEQRFSLLRQSIQLYRTEQQVTPRQLEITDQSVKLRDEIQLVIASMQSNEELSLELWVNASRDSIQQEIWISFLVIFLSFTTLAIASLLLSQQFIRRQQAEAMQFKLVQEKASSEVKLNFFSLVSHELRTPLSVILGSAQLLNEKGYWTEERKAKNLQRIQSSAKLMTRLLTDILTLTRAEADNLVCHPELIDVEAFCLNLVEEMQLNAAQPRIQFASEFASPPSSSLVRLDSNLLYSILSNLLENAMKYSAADQPILVCLCFKKDAVVFQVKDQGIGIAPADQHQVFELSYRGQNVGAIAGTGLGLAVVKKCVDVHCGQISIESDVGQGTLITVWLPLTVEPLRG